MVLISWYQPPISTFSGLNHNSSSTRSQCATKQGYNKATQGMHESAANVDCKSKGKSAARRRFLDGYVFTEPQLVRQKALEP
jgi:hypothetical protein